MLAPAIGLATKLNVAPLLAPAADRRVDLARANASALPEVKHNWLASRPKVEWCGVGQQAVVAAQVLAEREKCAVRPEVVDTFLPPIRQLNFDLYWICFQVDQSIGRDVLGPRFSPAVQIDDQCRRAIKRIETGLAHAVAPAVGM